MNIVARLGAGLKYDYNIRRYFMLIIMMIIMIAGFSRFSEQYATLGNLRNVFFQYSEIGVIALGMALIIITGNIDLSVGSVLCFTAFMVGMMMKWNFPVPLAVILGLVLGAVVGAVNGLFITKFKMQSVIVTLGTMTALRGLSFVVLSGAAIRDFPDQSFHDFGNGYLFGYLPYSFVLMLILYAALHIVIKKTKLGMNLVAIGNNETAARFSGIRTDLCKFLIFTFNGLIAAAAGISMLSRLKGLEASAGTGYEFDAITICLLGGVNIAGGQGTIFGTFLGLMAIAFLKNGMNLVRIDSLYQSVILGVILMATVIIGNLKASDGRLIGEIKRM